MTEILLEKIINKLAQDGLIDISPLHEKTISLSITPLKKSLTFYINAEQVFIFDEAKEQDVAISVGVDTFWQLLEGADISELIRSDAIVLNGEVKTAQLFVDILKENTIKKRLSAILPHEVQDAADTLKQKMKDGSLTERIISTLIQPKVYK